MKSMNERSTSKIPVTRVKSLLLSQNFCWLCIAALTCVAGDNRVNIAIRLDADMLHVYF